MGVLDDDAAFSAEEFNQLLARSCLGHLAVGADADITVLDMEKLEPVLAYANGKRIMEDGEVFPMPSRFITTSEGVAAVKAAGMEALVLEPGTWLPARD